MFDFKILKQMWQTAKIQQSWVVSTWVIVILFIVLLCEIEISLNNI